MATPPLWPRFIFAATLVSLAVSTGPATAESDVRPVNPAFGTKPWVAAPPTERATTPANSRTTLYRSRLESEIRRLVVHGPRDLKAKSRLKRFRRELSRASRR